MVFETRIDLRYSEKSRTYGPSSFLWFFFPLVLLKVVSGRSSGWKYMTPWVWKHKSGSHGSNLEYWEMEHTHGFKGPLFFQRTLYFMFLEMERGRQTCQNDLGFLWMWKWILTYVLSISHSWDTTMPPQKLKRSKTPSFYILWACAYICSRIIRICERDSLIFCRKQNKSYWMGEHCDWLS